MKLRIRQLKNDKWVCEVQGWFSWRGVEASGRNQTWPVGHYWFANCWCDSEEKATETGINYASLHGIGK